MITAQKDQNARPEANDNVDAMRLANEIDKLNFPFDIRIHQTVLTAPAEWSYSTISLNKRETKLKSNELTKMRKQIKSMARNKLGARCMVTVDSKKFEIVVYRK
jgi:hypothetical protein